MTVTRTLTKALLSKKYISVIYTLWIVINYLYLQSYLYGVSRIAYYDKSGSMSMTMFLSYIILTYSFMTFAYFAWIIWYDRENNHWPNIFIMIIISTTVLYVAINTPYWLKSIYEELPRWKYWDTGEWIGCSSEIVSENPALARFGPVSLCSYLPCLAISVFIYLRESSKEIISYSVTRVIFQILFLYIVYGIMSDITFFLVGSPCFVLLAMVRCNLMPSNKIIRKLIYALIIVYVLITVSMSAIMGNELCQSYSVIAIFGLILNAWFYFAVLVGLITALIKKTVKLKWEKPFFKGFLAGLISAPIMLFINGYIEAITY